MLKLERNELDLSLDFGYVEVLERVEKANAKFQASRSVPPDTLSAADKMRHYCKELCVPIDEIYAPVHGPNASDKIFADPQGVSFDTIFDFYRTIINGLLAFSEAQAQRNVAMARETADAQARVKANREEFEQLNAQNKANLDQMQAENATSHQKEQSEAAQKYRDTSVPYSDMSQRPKVPLAVAPAPIPGVMNTMHGGNQYAAEGTLLAEETPNRPQNG